MADSPDRIICSKCGERNEAERVFCWVCFARFGDVEPVPEVAPVPVQLREKPGQIKIYPKTPESSPGYATASFTLASAVAGVSLLLLMWAYMGSHTGTEIFLFGVVFVLFSFIAGPVCVLLGIILGILGLLSPREPKKGLASLGLLICLAIIAVGMKMSGIR